jgi:AcrR family transcriptional regulator
MDMRRSSGRRDLEKEPGRQVGRPRIVTQRKIIIAALDIGLKNLTMSRLADRLGMGTSTLYSHVKSREELTEIMQDVATSGRTPYDEKMHWSEVLEDRTMRHFIGLAVDTSRIEELLRGTLGPRVQLPYTDYVIGELVKRGLEIDDAYDLYRASCLLALGAALGFAHVEAQSRRREPWDEVGRAHLDELEPDDLPNIRLCAERYLNKSDFYSFQSALWAVIRQVSARRGESVEEYDPGSKSRDALLPSKLV